MRGRRRGARHLQAVRRCPRCGRPCYPGRKSARAAARLRYPKARPIVYRCGFYWHMTPREPLPALTVLRRQDRRRERMAW